MRVLELSPPRGAENHQENATLGHALDDAVDSCTIDIKNYIIQKLPLLNACLTCMCLTQDP